MKRGRKSIAEITMSPVANAKAMRLAPPSDLGRDEAALFRQLVASCPAEHFVASDMPLVVSFVQATVLSRRAAKALSKDASYVTVWEKATRMQATLATRLRLAPQSRIDSKTVGRRATAHRPSAYDLMGNDDD